jgi:hypothetical protein
MEFIISSTGYSGTHYITELLLQCGVNVGHEKIFTPFNDDLTINNLISQEQNEVAWESFLFLKYISNEIKIFQQTRDPIKVINAFLREGFWINDGEHRIWIEKQPDYPKDILIGSSVEKAMKWYYHINREIERNKPVMRYKIEDITGSLLQSILTVIGVEKSLDYCNEAVRNTSKTINTTKPLHPNYEDLKWSDLPHSEIKDKLMEMAKEYNYISELCA